MLKISEIVADREAGSQKAPWKWEAEDEGDWGHTWSLGPGILLADGPDGTPDGDEIDVANAKRIERVPDLEAAVLAAEPMADKLYDILEEIGRYDDIRDRADIDGAWKALAAYREHVSDA